MPTTTRSQRRRQPQPRSPQRRPQARVMAPPDYSRDYADARRDLLMILLIGGLLLVGMFVAYFII